MTRAPDSILTARKLLQQHLRLPAASLGVVGDPAHRGGYHCGRDRVVSGDYSVTESPRDAKPTDAASALDVGSFDITVAGKRHTLVTFSVWLANQCAAGTPDTADIREVIYSPDGNTVKRWDRLRRRATGDSSHRHHTHISWHRDSETRDKAAIFRRYLTHIGLLAAPKTTPTPEVSPMATAKDLLGADVVPNRPWRPDASTNPTVQWQYAVTHTWDTAHAVEVKVDKLLAAVSQLAGRDFTDEGAIASAVLSGLDPAKIAAAIPTTLARDVVDILTERLAT